MASSDFSPQTPVQEVAAQSSQQREQSERAKETAARSGSDVRLHDTLRLSANGVAKVLGDLEALVLQTVWDLNHPATARQVHEQVANVHDVQLHTVITVLNKLVDKGVLRRKKIDSIFHYDAVMNEQEFIAHASRRAVEGVLSLSPSLVATSFVDVLAEQDPEQLAELAALIQRKLKHDGSGQ
jgi:predicted transcriptional regulator